MRRFYVAFVENLPSLTEWLLTPLPKYIPLLPGGPAGLEVKQHKLQVRNHYSLNLHAYSHAQVRLIVILDKVPLA